jgi:hypothetical protein
MEQMTNFLGKRVSVVGCLTDDAGLHGNYVPNAGGGAAPIRRTQVKKDIEPLNAYE